MPIKQFRSFLIAAGGILLFGSGIRFYRLIRTHEEDLFFAPHLLLTCLSFYMAWVIFRTGLKGKAFTRKGAISLIRSGSLLAMLWGYRFALLLRDPVPGLTSIGMAAIYCVLGTLVMCVGLCISRSIRSQGLQPLENPEAST